MGNNFELPKMKIGSVSSSANAKVRKAEPEDGDKAVKKTSFNLPVDIHRNLKKLGAMEGRKLEDIIEEALLDVFRKYGI